MEPLIRISGRGALIMTLNGLTSGQVAVLQELIRSSDSGADLDSTPPSVLKKHRTSSRNTSLELALTGTFDQLKHVIRSFPTYCIPENLAKKIDSLLDNYMRSDYKINCRGNILDLGSRTHIMGILNMTPDSFSDGGLYNNAAKAFVRARDMAAAGADIIDIGGESTRPGAEPLSEEEELRRIIPVIEHLAAELAVPISVDTYKATVAKKALDAGASIVNDISGLRFSPDMAKVVAEYGAAVVIMHIKGTPRDMQLNPVYDDVVVDVTSYLEEGIAIAVKAGVDREKILIDPGIGFGKTLEHNLTLLSRLDELRSLGRPIVLGTSRKKFIGTILGIPVPGQRVDGTAPTLALGIERGARVVRVHDVGRMAQVVRMTDAVLKGNSNLDKRNPE
ncbi:MAG TPA: dihydropteroate synthase [Nitrospirota bacterium]|nr:dihydropteroate synthase [Nitrospirota bacterium]